MALVLDTRKDAIVLKTADGTIRIEIRGNKARIQAPPAVIVVRERKAA